MKKSFMPFAAIIAATVTFGIYIFTTATTTIAAAPVLLTAYYLDPSDKYSIQVARVECDALAEQGFHGVTFKHGVLRPWILEIDGPIKEPPIGYDVYACLGVG